MDSSMERLLSLIKDLVTYEKHRASETGRKILPRLEIGNGMDFPIKEPIRNGDANYKGHFVHAFNFKFKDGVSNDEITELMNELADLKGKIPVLKELVVGKNEAHWHRGFQARSDFCL